MKPLYRRWMLINFNQLLRHTSVALSTWAGIGFKEGHADWKGLGIAILSGAAIPTVIAFCAKGIPIDPEADEVITQDDLPTKT